MRRKSVNHPGNHLFPIQNDGYDFFTGVCADGRQMVMGLLEPHLVAYFFDKNGNLLGGDKRLLEKGKLLEQVMLEWQKELGFRTATIHVKEFYNREYPVGIEILPEHYRSVETDTWFPNEEERKEFIKSRNRWLTEGNFVWWWAKDYYMSKEGEVEST
jgi:hypothetical protein